MKTIRNLFLNPMSLIFGFSLLMSNCSIDLSDKDITSCFSRDYMAVQIDKDDSWSIIDKDGKIVVEEEYSPEDKISYISNSAFWVKSADKFMLFSIDSPKKPIIDDEFDMATEFECDRAFVRKDKTIKLIDTNGNVISTLPGDIAEVHKFSHKGYAVFTKKDGATRGILDKDGQIIFSGKYKYVGPVYSDYIITINQEDETSIHSIKGETIYKFKKDKIALINSAIIDDKIAAYSKSSENSPLFLMDIKGNKLFTIKKSDPSKQVFFEMGRGIVSLGYIESAGLLIDDLFVYASKDGKYGVTDGTGKDLIRPKYDFLIYTGSGEFVAIKEDKKIGIIDSSDKTLIPFEYDSHWGVKLGNNYILSQEDLYYLVNNKGETVSSETFYGISVSPCSSIFLGFDNNSDDIDDNMDNDLPVDTVEIDDSIMETYGFYDDSNIYEEYSTWNDDDECQEF